MEESDGHRSLGEADMMQNGRLIWWAEEHRRQVPADEEVTMIHGCSQLLLGALPDGTCGGMSIL